MVPNSAAKDDARPDPVSGRLRILETTDLHMQILPYDYFADGPDLRGGLVQLADQIAQLRADPQQTCLLFDNGDFLQGNPLADFLAASLNQRIHPMIAAFAALGYDAVTLGNHEFNYGLPFLRKALAAAPFGVVCANIDWLAQQPLAQPYVLLERMITCDDGHSRPIRLGIIGFVPPQVTRWDHAVLAGQIRSHDIVATARRLVPQIKAAGADLVIALCHAGIAEVEERAGMQNAAVPLAAVPDVDVILSGHIHDLFPAPDTSRPSVRADVPVPAPAIDRQSGSLHGKPAVAAGCFGAALGVIDLDLHWQQGRWQIAAHHSRTLRASRQPAQHPSAARLAAIAHADHAATLALIRQPITRSDLPIHSYLATITPDLPRDILARALRDYAGQMLSDKTLPVIAALAPFRAGGRAGPAHYVDIPAGPVTLRDISAIYPHPDTAAIVGQSGADLYAWLELAVSGYAQIAPRQAVQPLHDPDFAVHSIEALIGLTYQIDLSAPPRYHSDGTLRADAGQRIYDLRYQGRPVAPDDRFAVALSAYRAFGGAGASATRSDILHVSDQPMRAILRDYLYSAPPLIQPAAPVWRFVPVTGASAWFASAPAARAHLRAGIAHIGAAADGFDRYRLVF